MHVAPAGASTRASRNGPTAASDLAAQVVLPPGTTPLATAPTAVLAHEPVATQPSADEFDAHRLFTTAGSPSALVAYVRQHLPRGWSVSGPQIGPPPGGATLLAWVPGHGVHLEKGAVNYEAVPTGQATAFRVDAMVIWNPSRPSDESVPPTDPVVVTGHATARLSGQPTGPTTVSVTGPAATRIRRAFDALALASPAMCMEMESETAYTLRFAGRARTPAVRAVEATCPGPGTLSVTSGGTRRAPLLGRVHHVDRTDMGSMTAAGPLWD